ncbi:MAG: sulfotransferase [Gammaproteobacteria bacterium]|nr:sulfotransferase [Gammaproteobacteria bacterium]
MNPLSIFDAQKRGRLAAKVGKTFRQTFSAPVETTPVFVLGIQRSGTTMLMFAFHLHPEIAVYDESRASKAFFDFQLRSMETTEKLVHANPFPVACFKPLADSHLTIQLLRRFPSARCIWALREYSDVANSFLRKFPHATRAIRLVCSGQEGGGWFQEGVSEATGRILRNLPWQNFSDYDFACLIWWARNRIFFEQKLEREKRVLLLHYEKLVTAPEESLRAVTNFIGIPFSTQMIRYIHARSISKYSPPQINPSVQELCDEITASFSVLTTENSAKEHVVA